MIIYAVCCSYSPCTFNLSTFHTGELLFYGEKRFPDYSQYFRCECSLSDAQSEEMMPIEFHLELVSSEESD